MKCVTQFIYSKCLKAIYKLQILETQFNKAVWIPTRTALLLGVASSSYTWIKLCWLKIL